MTSRFPAGLRRLAASLALIAGFAGSAACGPAMAETTRLAAAILPGDALELLLQPPLRRADYACMQRCKAQYETCDRGCQYISDKTQQWSCIMGCANGRNSCEARCE